MSKQILLLAVGEAIQSAFERRCARDGARCVAFARHEVPASPSYPFSLCVVGSLREPDAVRAFRALRKMLRNCQIVVLAADLSTDVVVQLMRSGAADVIGLPLPAEDVVARASIFRSTEEGGEMPRLVGASAALRQVLADVRSVATVRSTILVSGETGTGKGLLARTIHGLSPRADRPFVHVDCGALAESVIESELFGHQKGAFTGAVENRPGRFEVASGGTIFLDEISELRPSMQIKLLRVLENREFERVGSTQTRAMTARVIAATNRDLLQLVKERRFRADLYFRIEVFHLRVPPLRERIEDIPALVHAGLARVAARLEVPVPAVTEGFCARLMEHAWPGNVRELMNTLERVLIRRHGPILGTESLDDFCARAQDSPGGCAETERENSALEDSPNGEAERATVAAILREVGGNLSRAARRLGMARSTLRYRVQQLGLEALIPRD